VDQLAATLATWMGVPATDLPLVLPQITNYTQRGNQGKRRMHAPS
jgi:hypothetical protein